VLWADVRDGWAQRSKRQPPFPALQDAIDDVFNARIGDVSGRGKLASDMREIWMMQPRFDKRTGNTPFGLVEQPRFRAGFDFMRLRADAGEVDETLADWWQEFSLASDAVREDLIDQARQESAKAPIRQRVRATPRRESTGDAPAPATGGDAAPDDDPDTGPDTASGAQPEGEAGAPPKRRRRRRRSNAAKNVANNEESTGI
jgi:poly(A) polymerase